MNTTTARIVAGACCVPVGLSESVVSAGLSGYGGTLDYASFGMGVAGSVHLVGGLALLAMGAVIAAAPTRRRRRTTGVALTNSP
jgi:hypothetical protein